MTAALCFSSLLAERLRSSPCHFVVTGASGWLGHATLAMLQQALGCNFERRVSALGSQSGQMKLANGCTLPVFALRDWRLPEAQTVIVFHYAFLTKDKVSDLSLDDYVSRNNAISETVRTWVATGQVTGVVLPSSGAVYDHLHNKKRDPAAALYGQMKYQDETAFTEACAAVGTGLVIPRVFNLSGPYINKFDSYALASFVLQALGRQPVIIKARHPVIRSYYFIGDLIELCLQLLFRQSRVATECFDVAGAEIIELGELAKRVAKVLAGQRAQVPIQRLPIQDGAVEDRYLGSRDKILQLETPLSIAPMPLDIQIKVTAAYIESTLGLQHD
jgi:nucleoside-diphosphate-sugar epimerase